MIVVACPPCAHAIRVMPATMGSATAVDELELLVGQRSEFWPDKYPCPWCESKMTGMREREADTRVLALMKLVDLNPQEAFAAFYGLGLPDEQQCSLQQVQELLREQPVRRVLGTNVRGVQRTLIDALELWDGTKVYFGAASEGAVIYRITRPISYTQKALESHEG